MTGTGAEAVQLGNQIGLYVLLAISLLTTVVGGLLAYQEKRRNTTNTHLASASASLTTVGGQLDGLVKTITDANTTNQRLVDQILRFKDEQIEQIKQRFDDQARVSVAERQMLESKIKEQQATHENQINLLKAELTTLQAELSNKNIDLEQAHSKAITHQQTIETLQNQIIDEKKMRTDLESNFNEKIEGLQRQLDQVNKRLDEQMKTNAELETINKQITTERDQLRADNVRLADDNQQLREQLKTTQALLQPLVIVPSDKPSLSSTTLEAKP